MFAFQNFSRVYWEQKGNDILQTWNPEKSLLTWWRRSSSSSLKSRNMSRRMSQGRSNTRLREARMKLSWSRRKCSAYSYRSCRIVCFVLPPNASLMPLYRVLGIQKIKAGWFGPWRNIHRFNRILRLWLTFNSATKIKQRSVLMAHRKLSRHSRRRCRMKI